MLVWRVEVRRMWWPARTSGSSRLRARRGHDVDAGSRRALGDDIGDGVLADAVCRPVAVGGPVLPQDGIVGPRPVSSPQARVVDVLSAAGEGPIGIEHLGGRKRRPAMTSSAQPAVALRGCVVFTRGLSSATTSNARHHLTNPRGNTGSGTSLRVACSRTASQDMRHSAKGLRPDNPWHPILGMTTGGVR